MEIHSEGLRASVSPEARFTSVKSVVDRVERVLQKHGEREPGKRFGACGYASNLIRYVAENKGIHADIFQVNDIHKKFGGQNQDAFRHTFTILRDKNGSVLVDQTFGQFVNPQTLEIVQGVGSKSGHASEFPLHRLLLKDGFVSLTDDSLREYLRATSTSNDKSYIDQITVKDIMADNSLPLDWDYTAEDLESYLDGSISNSRHIQGKYKSLMGRVQERFFPPRL